MAVQKYTHVQYFNNININTPQLAYVNQTWRMNSLSLYSRILISNVHNVCWLHTIYLHSVVARQLIVIFVTYA